MPNKTGDVIRAKYDGVCCMTGKPYGAGTFIKKIGDRRWAIAPGETPVEVELRICRVCEAATVSKEMCRIGSAKWYDDGTAECGECQD